MNVEAKPARPRHTPIREEWLALRLESALDPGEPLIDAHHHLWDKPGNRYMGADLAADIAGGHNVVATVFAEGLWGYLETGEESLRSVGETAMAARAAMEAAGTKGGPRLCAGIVGNVDLAIGTRAGEILDRHIEAGEGRFRGVRNASAWHADPEARGSVLLPPKGLLYDSGFRDGLKELVRRDLVFDAWMYHTQLDELVDLARVFPDAAIALNHIGGPIGIGPYAGRRSEVFAAWREGMRKVAVFDNIHVKLGGLGMPMTGFGFEDRQMPPSSDDLAAAWAPYFEACIAHFRAERCMFESNFPVDKGIATYTTMWNAFKKIAAPYSSAERGALFFDTANRLYSLGVARP